VPAVGLVIFPHIGTRTPSSADHRPRRGTVLDVDVLRFGTSAPAADNPRAVFPSRRAALAAATGAQITRVAAA
jgi:hypothetical protein